MVDSSNLPFLCHKCGAELHPGRGDFYQVKIEAVADPFPPVITEEELRRDHASEMARLLEAAGGLSEQEALDQIYRRLTIYLCNPCYREWIEKPTG